jgi:ferrochelatase
MPRYLPEPNPPADGLAKPGILLVNLGSPQAPTAPAVRRYLREFLSDPRVVELPRLPWLALLNGVVLWTRPRVSAQRYAAVWSTDGSPLVVHTARQAVMLRGYLGERVRAPLEVGWGMRYGSPSIAQALSGLRDKGCDRVLLLPLYPQYAGSTTATAFDALATALARMRNQPALRVVKDFHDHPGYVGALAQSVRDYWMQNGRGDVLVMSFHGVPQRTIDLGDPYYRHCQATGRLLAAALALPPERYRIAFQSRFGRSRWLEPSTVAALTELGRRGTARVDVICPGFVSDCLETLEEIALEGKGVFLRAGGKSFHYLPCLNERDDWLRALADVALENLHGWLPGAAAARHP